MKLMGGSRAFVNKLQKVFDDNLFDMANEPDINYPYLFNFVNGEEWRTQKMVRHLIDSHYHSTPGGIPGNDDCGTLSSWLVYSMMGFYPVCPGDMRYALTTPVFDRVVIQLDSNYYPGKQFEIVTHRNSKSSVYIDRMQLNGKSVSDYFLLHKKLTEGGKLEFFLK
jgi:predicted alpha-1,2-mannosidase